MPESGLSIPRGLPAAGCIHTPSYRTLCPDFACRHGLALPLRPAHEHRRNDAKSPDSCPKWRGVLRQ